MRASSFGRVNSFGQTRVLRGAFAQSEFHLKADIGIVLVPNASQVRPMLHRPLNFAE